MSGSEKKHQIDEKVFFYISWESDYGAVTFGMMTLGITTLKIARN